MADRESLPRNDFGEVLRNYRLAAGLTQQALAERAGVSVEAVSTLERGLRRRPRRETVNLLVAALGLTEAQGEALVGAIRRPGTREAPPPGAPDGGGLVGRDEERLTAYTLLAGETRLLTLAGPPGVGKSRLAAAVAAELRPAFPDGVVEVDLAPVADPQWIATAIGQALGTPGPALVESIGGRRLLLVLDTFEHVLDGGPLLTELLAECPGLRLLVTSRAVLHLRDERVLPLPPLRTADATALFLERARACSPAFRPGPEERRAVAEICRRLDGLPLAVELAARWMKVLDPQTLLARLSARLDMLVDGARDLPDRQRTMRDALEWSYRLLTAPERLLFRQFSTFADGAGLEAVEAVCGPAPPGDTLRLVARLVDQSLLLRQDENGLTGPRITMLGAIREYGRELLAGAERTRAARAHAAYHLELARRAEPELAGPGQADWLARLDLDRHNLLAALRWLDRRDEVGQGLELAARLWRFWDLRGDAAEGSRWVARWLERDDGRDRAVRALALRAAGVLAWRQGDHLTARARGVESLALYRLLGDAGGTDAVLNNLAGIAWQRGDVGLAVDNWRLSVLLMGGTARPPGGDARAEARALLVELARLRHRRGDLHRLALTLVDLADACQAAGDLEGSERVLERCLELCRDHVPLWPTTLVLNRLGDIALAAGDPDRADAMYQDSFKTCRTLAPSSVTAIHSVEGLAAAAAARGKLVAAVRLYGAAAASREPVGAGQRPSVRVPHDRIVTDLRHRLGTARFQAAWEAGRALSLDEAVARPAGDAP